MHVKNGFLLYDASQTSGSGKYRKLQAGSGARPSRKWVLVHFELERTHMW